MKGGTWNAHLTEAACENVDDLMAMGESMEHALAQAGIERDAYDKHRHRHPGRRRADA